MIYGKRKHNSIYREYTFFFLLLGVVIYLAVIARHGSLVANGDCFNQFYPVLSYLSKYYRYFFLHILDGVPKLYDTNIGFGDSIIGALSYYGFGDAFTMIATLFPVKYMSYAYTLITVVRLFLSGISFIFYGKYKKISDYPLLLGALLYTYSFFAIGIGMTAFSFTTVMVYFPLIFYGIDRLMNERKSGWMQVSFILVVAVFLQSLCGFYFLYMDILACVLYFIVQGMDRVVKKIWNVKKFFLVALNILINFALGVGAAGVLFIPVIEEYFQCYRHGDVSFSIMRLFALPDKETLINSLRNIITPAKSGYENGLCIPIIVIPIVVYLVTNCRKEGYWKQILFLAIAMWGILFPAVGTISNGFAYSTIRWTYILYFFLSFIVAVYYDKVVSSFSRINFQIYLMLYIVWLFSFFILNILNSQMIFRVIICSLIWVIVIFFIGKIALAKQTEYERVYKRLWYVSIMSIAASGVMFYAPQKIGGSGAGAGFKGLNFVDSEIRSSKLAQECSKDTTDEFYRYDYNDTSLDAPLMLGANTTYLYYSMCNGSVYNVFNQLRISPAIMHTFTLQGLDGRQALETLMSVKTYATDTDNWNTTQNKYFLPLGFTYEKAVSEKTVESFDQLKKMNVMMSDVIVGNDKVGKIAKVDNASEPGDIISDCTEHQIPINITYGSDIIRNGNRIKVNDGSTIRVEFTPLQNQETGDELYLYLRNLTSDPSFKYDISLAGKTIRLRDKKDMWYFDNNFDYLVQVQNVASSGVINIVFQNAGEYTLNDIELVENSIGSFEEKYEKLGKDTLKDTVIDGNSVSGSISLDKGKWLFLSLPYDKGWNCKIDGIDTEILRANYSFMTVYIPDGVHNVRFCYETPGLKVGLLLSIISLLIFIVLCIIGRKNEKREN